MATQSPNGIAIELYFDARTEDTLTRVQAHLAGQGWSFDLPAAGARPHISLAVFGEVDEEKGARALDAVADSTPPFDVQMPSLGIFPGPPATIHLGVASHPSLSALNDRATAVLAPIGEKPHRLYEPGIWLPHVTLGGDIALEHVDDAFRVVRELVELPIAARCEAIALVAFRPTREVARMALTGGG
jgi:2'-5' RNA ligase